MTILWLLFLLHVAYAGKITKEENSKLKERCNAKRTVQANKYYKRFQVAQSKYPFAVALSKIYVTRTFKDPYGRILNYETAHTEPFCSGVLISSRHILTAAHCLKDLKRNAYEQGLPETYKKIGVFHQSTCTDLQCWLGKKTYEVAFTQMHERYMAYANVTSFDIGVIELMEDVFFDFSPICMPQANDSIPQKAFSIGYGQYRGDLSIQAVAYDRTSEDLKNNAIVAYTKYKEESIIPGDSGGPLVHQLEGKHYLIGIASSSMEKFYKTPRGLEFSGEVWSRFVDVREHLVWICDWTGVCPLSGDSGDQDQPPSNGFDD